MEHKLLPLKVITRETNEQIIHCIQRRLSELGKFVNMAESIEIRQSEADVFGEPRTELLIKVSASSWKVYLLKLISAYQHIFIRWYGMHCIPVLRITNRGFFSWNCTPAQMSLPLNSVHFGNLIDSGNFLSHFSRFANIDDCKKCCEILNTFMGINVCHPMVANFEHDLSILTIRFAGVEDSTKVKNKADKTNSAQMIPGHVITLKMKYSSVRGVLVDTCFVAEEDDIVTRIYFYLNHPIEIKKLRKFIGSRYSGDGVRDRFFPERRFDSRNNCAAINDSPVLCVEFTKTLKDECLYELLSRLRARIGLPIDFASILHRYFPIERYIPLPVQLIGCDYRRVSSDERNNYNGRTAPPIAPAVGVECAKRLRRRGDFALEYLIAALLSRGAIVKDQILLSIDDRKTFMNHILERYDEDSRLTVEALERLLCMIDERTEPPPLLDLFERIRVAMVSEVGQLKEIKAKEMSEGFRYVRKVVITPTRTLLVAPELLMGNRVLRNFDPNGELALRVQFRDDNDSALRGSIAGSFIIETTVYNALLRGIYIAGRHFVYLGSSNSQMREGGCYFFDDDNGGGADYIRRQLGIFNRSNIPKLMARMGQCFTQARQCSTQLHYKDYNETLDIIGGRDSAGKPYIFSDGCGRLAPEYAKRIAIDLGIKKCVPSCFQIRYRGYKGVLSVDPWLAEWSQFVQQAKTTVGIKLRRYELQLLFRSSQNKFRAPSSKNMEIVKYSSPAPVILNRSLISILDQVSLMQNYQSHCRITRRISSLLSDQVLRMVETLLSEYRGRCRLEEIPKRIDISELSPVRGFALTQEPFFRNLLKAIIVRTIKKLITKIQIEVPPRLGRSMFGIIDESGILQYGQVFIQYTNDISLKLPTASALKTVLKGRVLITKYPCSVAGDVRMFEAIDVPELRHLVDVVVFPQYGPRPHSDEMAGSDLDGDEYCVIWDEQLFLDGNENAMSFASSSSPLHDFPEHDVVTSMRSFFVEYIKQDAVGTIANSLLANADLHGITSQVCMNIAAKLSMALDFPKTGEAPLPLLKFWKQHSDGTYLPPEKVDRWPDFMNKHFEPRYESPRLLGQLFRRIRLIDDLLLLVSSQEKQESIILDTDLICPRNERYCDIAKIDFDAYSADILALMDNYGIDDESELFTGFMNIVRNRINEREMDTLSSYNTPYTVGRKVSYIFQRFRSRFFEEFGGFIENTDPVDENNHSEDYGTGLPKSELRICRNPSVAMKMKASAYYEVCYANASTHLSDKRILSFPWIVWDILARVKESALRTISTDPFCESLSNRVNEFCKCNWDDFHRFKWQIVYWSSAAAIRRYCRRYCGLYKLMFVVCKWAHNEKLFDGRFTMEHLCLLLIQFGIGFYSCEHISRSAFLEETNVWTMKGLRKSVRLNDRLGGIGKCFIDFLRFLSSDAFGVLREISFREPKLGCRSFFLRGQFSNVHEAAIISLYRLVLSGRVDALFMINDHTVTCGVVDMNEAEFVEMRPFVVELPAEMNKRHDEFAEEMRHRSGVKYLQLRRLPKFENRAVVSAVGTVSSLQCLRDLMTMKAHYLSKTDDNTMFLASQQLIHVHQDSNL